MEQAMFKRGDLVVDRGGYRGAVVNVTHWEGSVWYDVRFMDGCRNVGVAVRFNGDLQLQEEA